jgi:hypothetical protein
MWEKLTKIICEKYQPSGVSQRGLYIGKYLPSQGWGEGEIPADVSCGQKIKGEEKKGEM